MSRSMVRGVGVVHRVGVAGRGMCFSVRGTNIVIHSPDY